MARLDHISVVASSLEVGSAYVEAALGVKPVPGRAHPSMATHNMLLALGADVYLEVIAADPGAVPPTRPRWFGLDQIASGSVARLGAWVASTTDISGRLAPEFGEVETMYREAHSWQMAICADGAAPFEGAAPLLIQRAPGANPVAALPPTDLQFERLLVRHPSPDRVLAALKSIGLAPHPCVSVMLGSKSCLLAEIETPSGTRLLGEV